MGEMKGGGDGGGGGDEGKGRWGRGELAIPACEWVL